MDSSSLPIGAKPGTAFGKEGAALKLKAKFRKEMSHTEKTLILIIVLLAVLIALMWLLLGRRLLAGNPAADAPAQTDAPSRRALSMPEDYLPKNLAVGSLPPDAVFEDETGKPIPLSDLFEAGKEGLWLVFFASWCPDCDNQLRCIGDMEALADQYNIKLVLADRLNRSKESVEKAREKIAQAKGSAPIVYDADEKVYRSWGFQEIPSAVVLDQEGAVRSFAAGVLTPGECEGLLKRALLGRAKVGLSFIRERLCSQRGGVYTSTATSGESPTGQDVLSESQGLMLLYALMKDDRALFDQTLSFIQTDMLENNLAAWYVSSGQKAPVNASLDDLRLICALKKAGKKWGNEAYDQAARNAAEALLRLCVNDQGGLVDYALLNGEGQAQTISLCYLDVEGLRELAGEIEGFAPVLERAEEILLGGRISDDFPFYYASYDYAANSYSRADLNTAEALYALWNLSRAKELPGDAWAYLKSRIETGSLAARYHIDGTAVKGFEYHSTAVWGLAALIAREEGDENAFELALRRMDRLLVLDAGDALFGAYAQKGAAVYAFDQLIPLLANAWADEKPVAWGR